MPVQASIGDPSIVDPYVLYSLRFNTASGISCSRIRLAARAGVELETLKNGRRVFVEGTAGIAYFRTLTTLHEETKPMQKAGDA
jgi:hypothetical protein